MARLLIDGFELGAITTAPGWATTSGTLESTTVKSGAYSSKGTLGTGNTFLLSSLNKTALYMKAWVYFDIATNVTTQSTITLMRIRTSAPADIAMVEAVVTTGGAITLQVVNAVASTTPISGISMSAGAWHCIEFKCTINASTGILEIKLDGSTTTASSQNTGSTNIGQGEYLFSRTAGTGGSINQYWDDLAIDDAAHCGQSKIICRQTSANPSWNTGDDTWAKSTGTTAYNLWDDTPHSETDYCDSSTNTGSLEQRGKIATFSSTQTGHGSDTIGSSDTINVAQIIARCKRSGGSGRTHYLLYGDHNSDNQTNLSLSTSYAYYAAPIYTNTVNNLTNTNDQEIGGGKSASGGQDMFISDMWMMVEYTPVGSVTTTQTIQGRGRMQKVQTATTTGKAAIRNTTTRTTDGRSRLQKAVLATLAGISRIQKVVQATLGGRSTIHNTTLRAVDGRSRLQKAALQTTDGRSRVQKVQTPTIDGRTRIQNTTNQTTQGRGRVQKTIAQTINGIAMIVATTQQTIQGLARITATTLRTIQAVARIQDTTQQTTQGRSRLSKVALQTLQGLSRIQDVVAATLNGLSRITATLSQNLQGRSRLQKSASQTIQGRGRILHIVVVTLNAISRITKVQAQTLQGQSRIQKVQSPTIQGVSRLLKTLTQTIQGIAKIAGATTQTIQAVARLLKLQSQTTQGKARLQKSFSQTTTGQSRIGKVVLATLSGVSRIYKTLTQTLQGRSRILRTFAVTINATARILKSVSATIQGVARIIYVTAQVLNGRSRIQLVVTTTIEGKANIYATIQKNILGRSKITLGAVDQEILSQARLIRVRQADVFGQTRMQKAAERTIQARSKIATFGPGVGSTNKISFDMTTTPVQLGPNVDSIRMDANSRPVEFKMQ
jgi:hypothetical protein